MAYTVTAADDPMVHAIRLHFTGFDPTHKFRITRPDYNTRGHGPITVWNDAVLKPPGDVVDFIAPFNVTIEYEVTDLETGSARSVYAYLDFNTSPRPPAFDTSVGEWPILRAPLEEGDTRPPSGPPGTPGHADHIDLFALRVPILSYQANFGMRSVKHSILSSPYPIMSADVTELKSGVMTWATSTKATRLRLLEIVETAGHLLHLRAPCVVGALDDLFFVVTSLTENAPVVSNPAYRVWTVGFQQVIAPPPYSWDIPPVTGAPGGMSRWTLDDLRDSGMTLDQLRDTGWSLYELSLQTTGQPPAQYTTGVSAPRTDPYVGSV